MQRYPFLPFFYPLPGKMDYPKVLRVMTLPYPYPQLYRVINGKLPGKGNFLPLPWSKKGEG